MCMPLLVNGTQTDVCAFYNNAASPCWPVRADYSQVSEQGFIQCNSYMYMYVVLTIYVASIQSCLWRCILKIITNYCRGVIFFFAKSQQLQNCSSYDESACLWLLMCLGKWINVIRWRREKKFWESKKGTNQHSWICNFQFFSYFVTEINVRHTDVHVFAG